MLGEMLGRLNTMLGHSQLTFLILGEMLDDMLGHLNTSPNIFKGLFKRSNISPNISASKFYKCWPRCSNDPTFHPTFENNGIVGYRHTTFLTSIKLHPTSEMSMLGYPTWCSNEPTFHPIAMLSKCWAKCWIF